MSLAYPLLGIERVTLDYYVPTKPSCSGVSGYASTNNVAFVSKDEWDRIATECGPLVHPVAGGNVGNCLTAYRMALGVVNPQLRAYWYGFHSGDRESCLILRTLIESGVHAYATCAPGSSTKVMIIGNAPGDVRSKEQHHILVRSGAWPKVAKHLPRILDMRYLLCVGLDSLVDENWPYRADIEKCRVPYVLLVNHIIRSHQELHWLAGFLEHRHPTAVIGTLAEVTALALELGRAWGTWSTQWSCEVVATSGKGSVVAYNRGTRDPLTIPVTPVPMSAIISTVGAGDEFAGRFLAARRLLYSMPSAVCQAASAAAGALGRLHARPSRESIIRALCRTVIRSRDIERIREIREQLEWGCAPIVVSGGQTGVDQLALERASACGIAAHAIMPAGLRTEHGKITPADIARFGNPAIHELHDRSYRSRTWASAFIGDATLMFRSLDTNGARETEAASSALGRPLFVAAHRVCDLNAVVEFLIRHDVGVLNIAGHRESLLDPTSASWISLFLDGLLQSWSAAYAVNHPLRNLPALLDNATFSPKVLHKRMPKSISGRRRFLLAIPSSGSMRRVTLCRLGVEDDGNIVTRKCLRREVPHLDCKVVFGRPRDMACWMTNRHVDAVIGGLDELLEGGAAGRLIYDFGLFRSSISLLMHPSILHSTQSANALVLSQIPNLAQRLFEEYRERTVQVVPICGTAESWLYLGYGDAYIDTIHSGSSARANGLEPFTVLGETSLCLVARDNLGSRHEQVLQTIVERLRIPVQ